MITLPPPIPPESRNPNRLMARRPPSVWDLLAFAGCFVLPVLGAAAVVGLAVIFVLLALYR